jgi:16S rRNA processing protein RimM
METILKTDCTKIGFIQKPHGIHGELVVRFQEEYYETLDECPTLFLEIDNLLVPFFITGAGLRFKSGETVIAQLEWVDSEKKAKDLCGVSVYVSSENIRETEGEPTSHELVGYHLYDEHLGLIGDIDDVMDFSGNLLISVQYHGQEALVPLNEKLIVSIDDTLQEIVLRIPEGLFEINED